MRDPKIVDSLPGLKLHYAVRKYRRKPTFLTYAPIKRKAAALSRLFDATDKKERVPGIRRACSIGLSICNG